MTIIGVTGHQNLPEAARAHADHEIRTFLAVQPKPLVGLSSLAEGADQLFAEILLSLGGTLQAVIPARGYVEVFTGEIRPAYQRLVATADSVITLDYDKPGEDAYYAAGQFVVEHSDLLLAIWDGEPARGLGGTGDAVRYARSLGHRVLIIWPKGIRRN